MMALQNIKFKHKIATIALVPLLGLIFLAVVSISTQYKHIQSADKIIILADFSAHASALVHELQKERGMSAGYLGSHGLKFKQAIIKQRQLSDQKLTQLNIYIKNSSVASATNISSALNSVLNDLRQIQTIRANVSNLSASTKSAIGYYSDINQQFLNIIAKLPQLSSDIEMSSNLAAYANGVFQDSFRLNYLSCFLNPIWIE